MSMVSFQLFGKALNNGDQANGERENPKVCIWASTRIRDVIKREMSGEFWWVSAKKSVVINVN